MPHLLRVGDAVVNLDNVETLTLVRGGIIWVEYVGDSEEDDVTVFSGQAAQALREWLLDTDNVEYCQGSGGTF